MDAIPEHTSSVVSDRLPLFQAAAAGFAMGVATVSLGVAVVRVLPPSIRAVGEAKYSLQGHSKEATGLSCAHLSKLQASTEYCSSPCFLLAHQSDRTLYDPKLGRGVASKFGSQGTNSLPGVTTSISSSLELSTGESSSALVESSEPTHSHVVLWDFENTRFDTTIQSHEVIRRITVLMREARAGGECDPVRITGIGNVNVLTVAQQSDLQCGGVTLVHVQSEGRKEAADKHLLVEFGLTLKAHSPRNSTIAIISGDKDFAYAMSTARALGYRTTLFCPSGGSTSPFLSNAVDVVWSWKRDVLSHCRPGSRKRRSRSLPSSRRGRASLEGVTSSVSSSESSIPNLVGRTSGSQSRNEGSIRAEDSTVTDAVAIVGPPDGPTLPAVAPHQPSHVVLSNASTRSGDLPERCLWYSGPIGVCEKCRARVGVPQIAFSILITGFAVLFTAIDKRVIAIRFHELRQTLLMMDEDTFMRFWPSAQVASLLVCALVWCFLIVTPLLRSSQSRSKGVRRAAKKRAKRAKQARFSNLRNPVGL